MCGRVALFSPPDRLAELFGVSMGIGFRRRYNIAPQAELDVVALDPATGQRIARHPRWGLVPSWAKDETIGLKLVNARAETAASKPAFRHAFAHNRVLVPADGYYEWQPAGKLKQPWFIHMKDRSPFAIAGMTETWTHDGHTLETAVVLTTTPNRLVEPMNKRMPVIIAPPDWDAWLDPGSKAVSELLRPFPAELMDAYPVGRWVNNPKYDTDRCIEPLNG
jgi:putative SOS response-associated peptidase YedK